MTVEELSSRPGAFLVATEPNLVWEGPGQDGPGHSGGDRLESQRSDDLVNRKLGMFIACWHFALDEKNFSCQRILFADFLLYCFRCKLFSRPSPEGFVQLHLFGIGGGKNVHNTEIKTLSALNGWNLSLFLILEEIQDRFRKLMWQTETRMYEHSQETERERERLTLTSNW